MKEKTPLLHEFVCNKMPTKTLKDEDWSLLIFWVQNDLFLKNYFTHVLLARGAVSHKALYYQELSIACYQAGFYANLIIILSRY